MNEPASEKKVLRLIEGAFVRTTQGKLDWVTTDDPDLFAYMGARTSLMIDFFDLDQHFEFRVLDDRGSVVERFARWPGPDVEGPDPWKEPTDIYILLRDLHAAARRSALNIDKILDDAFADLDNPSPDL